MAGRKALAGGFVQQGHERRAVRYVNLGEDVLDVGFHRGEADAQAKGDLLVREPFGYQLRDVALACRECGQKAALLWGGKVSALGTPLALLEKRGDADGERAGVGGIVFHLHAEAEALGVREVQIAVLPLSGGLACHIERRLPSWGFPSFGSDPKEGKGVTLRFPLSCETSA